MKYDFTISVEYMLEDDVGGIIDGVSVVTAQGSDVLCVDICDNFLSQVSLNRKDLFEGTNQLFVFFFITVAMN